MGDSFKIMELIEHAHSLIINVPDDKTREKLYDLLEQAHTLIQDKVINEHV